MPEIDPTQSALANYAVQLRWIRRERHLTQNALGAMGGVHVSGKTIEAVENMRRLPTRRLSTGLDKGLLTTLFSSLYAAYLRETGLPPGFIEYAEREAEASRILTYSQHGLDGLFQCESWAREVLTAGKTKDDSDEALARRAARQEILRRENPPQITLLLDEAVIQKIRGVDNELAKQQLQHLVELNAEPHITILICPFTARVYPEGAFTVLSFDTDPDMAYLDAAGGNGVTLEPGPQVTSYAVLFDCIRDHSKSAPESSAWLQSVVEEL